MIEYIIQQIDLFFYHNWKLFAITGDTIFFIYSCAIAFLLGFAHGLIN